MRSDMAIEIVPLGEDLSEGYRAVLDSVAREERYLALLQAFPPEATRAFIAAGVASGRPMFAARVAGEIVGWCDILVDKPLETLKHTGSLGMGVLRSHRGRGVGRALLERTLADARAKGLTRIELAVGVDNERAKKLYEKFGFQVEGLVRRHMRVRGEYKDSYLMALLYD